MSLVFASPYTTEYGVGVPEIIFDDVKERNALENLNEEMEISIDYQREKFCVNECKKSSRKSHETDRGKPQL